MGQDMHHPKPFPLAGPYSTREILPTQASVTRGGREGAGGGSWGQGRDSLAKLPGVELDEDGPDWSGRVPLHIWVDL